MQLFELDPLSVLLQFSRRADTFSRANFLLREVEARLLERIDLPVPFSAVEPSLSGEPTCVLDVGCGLGASLPVLKQRYPGSLLIGLDFSSHLLKQAVRGEGWFSRWRQKHGWGGVPPWRYVAADAAHLPVASGQVDMLWSNLLLHWLPDLPGGLREWFRVLRQGGVLHASFLSCNSFSALRSIGADFMPFCDLQAVGDLALQEGFIQPVLDADRLTLTWESVSDLVADLHALGGNAMKMRRPGLSTPQQKWRWYERLEALRQPDGLLHLGVEVVFLRAYRSLQPSAAPEWVPVPFSPRR